MAESSELRPKIKSGKKSAINPVGMRVRCITARSGFLYTFGRRVGYSVVEKSQRTL